ncbi:hypothetical protein SH139x_002442 [Planctomycetaceae bacterium SH139]
MPSLAFGPSIRRHSAFKMVFLGSGFVVGTPVRVQEGTTRLDRRGSITYVSGTHAVADFAAIVSSEEKEEDSPAVTILDDDILDITVTVGTTVSVGPGVVSP